MKKQDALNLFQGLNTLAGLKGVKFSYAVAKNINILKGEVESLEKSITPSEEFSEYDKKRIELAKKYAELDESGELKSKDFKIIFTDEAGFKKALAPLLEEYKDALAKRDEQMKEYAELLKEESDVQLHKLKIEDVPEDISTEQMYVLYPIIEE